MDSIISTMRGVVDQLNPLSQTNVTIFFIWLPVFTLTGVAVWRAERRWLRGILYLIHQFFTIGVIINWSTVIVVSIFYWWQALAVFCSCFGSAYVMTRRRRHNTLLEQQKVGPPITSGGGRLRLGAPQ